MGNYSTLGRNETRESALKPLPLHHAVLHFLAAGLVLRFSVYNGLPWLVTLGVSPFDAFILAGTLPMALLFALAFGLARREGTAPTASALAQRFRLRRPTWRDGLWVLAGLALLMVSGAILAPWREPFMEWMKVDLPASFPPLIDPRVQNSDLPRALAAWLGPQAMRSWRPVLGILTLFFFNIFGEELYWRGLLFPRQALVHGKRTWWVHGLLWNLFHVPLYPWYLVLGLPVTLTVSFVAQKTGNTWAPILLHALANVSLTLLVIGVVLSGV
jgi:membrane protease YdiL (CAAX protease family)